MLHADKGQSRQTLDGKNMRIGIVQARFNANITDALFAACRQELLNLGVSTQHMTHLTVPGALEVPVVLQALARQGRFDALVALLPAAAVR